ncbi:MAG TPA: TIM-barrel domain-containing protein [Terracidiphilus sp.]|nr:TIM-barrel domain-containing protein [Terracidiphilus sp.]
MSADRLTKISRRSLAKGLAAAGTITGLSGLVRAESQAAESTSANWKQVHPGVWKATIGTPERFSPVVGRLVPVQTEAFSKLPKVDAAPLPALRGKRTSRGCIAELPLRPNEQIFGMGLQLLSFAQRGKKKVVRVNADPKFDTGDSHAPVPFYVTTEGIGILVDTARYATFFFGDARPKPAHAVESVSSAGFDPNYTHNIQDGDVGKVTIEVPHAAGVDVYLFAGPEMLDAVRRYNVFSGGGVNPPEWGLGFWYRMDARGTQQSTLALADEFRDRKIPCDVIGLEPGWQTHAYSCTFAWDKGRFPDPTGFVREAGEKNYKINLWEHAYTHPASPLFSAIEPHSGDYGVWGGLVPDFAGEAARAAFGAYHAKTFLDAGVSGFKLDECDNSDYTGGWSFPECSTFPSGVDGEQMHNVFGLYYQMAIWNEYRKRGQATYNLVRSSGAIAAPYPFVLYSDLYAHRDYIRALVNSGFSGLLWCPEVRDAVSEEDLIRRLQSVMFSPIAMVNGWYIKNPPWKQLNRKLNNADQLIEDWEKLEARCREIIGWRMSLVPYLIAAFQRYAADGTPPFRALVLDAPKESRLYRVDDQFMVGDRMMVAPLFAGEPERTVVLPKGQWHDFWTGEAVGDGSDLTIAASTEKIPVYVKSGSIVPWAEVGLHVDAPETRRLTARVYGDGSLPFTLRDGDRSLRLSWAGDRGNMEGATSYDVIAWKRMG